MKKLNQDELLKVQELRQKLTEIISTLGELHLNKLILLSDIKTIEKQQAIQETHFEKFQEEERVLYESLQEKYGTGSIDIETGEITE